MNAPATAIFHEKCDLDNLTLKDDLDFGIKERVLPPRNTNVKYKHSITYHSKAMTNVKVFEDKDDLKNYPGLD